MSQDKHLLNLIESARQDQTDALNQLADGVQGRLYAYIYRTTLDPDLAQDLTQEVLMAMVKSLRDLEKPERFWPWLYRIAQRKILEYYRAKRRKDQLAKSESFQHDMTQRVREAAGDAAHTLAKKDLAKQTLTAMRNLQEQHRAVLSLRCFDQLAYADIAAVMDCTEAKARVLFYRAKQALRKQLAGQGVDRYLLVACLGVFGELTAPAEAAAGVAVTAASTKVGIGTTIVALLTGKWALRLAVTTVAVLGLIVGTLQTHSGPVKAIIRDRSDVKSMHFTIQLSNVQAGVPTSLSKGAYEQWYYYPEDVDGPVFRRMQRWTPQQTEKLCAWLQNGQGNYYYASDKGTVTIRNYPVAWSNLTVATLPTDPPEMAAFLEKVQHAYDGVTFARDPNTQLPSEAVDTRFADAMDFKTTYRYNTIDQDFFAYGWSEVTPVIDKRDAMHRRGWTYVEINGNIGDRIINGRSRIAFAYDAYREHPAWMTLTIDDLTIADTQRGAWTQHAGDTEVTTYPSGAFFCGLMRPWMGLHTLDLVRRDAAKSRLWFRTAETQEPNEVRVTVYDNHDQPHVELVYTVDREYDLLRRIDFVVDSEKAGHLEFDYLDNIETVDERYVTPTTSVTLDPPNQPAPELPWLFALAKDTPATKSRY